MRMQLAQWTENKTRLVILVLIALYLLLFLPFWQPVVLGFLFAAACEPIVNIGRRRLHARRTRMAYLTVGVGLAFFIALFAIVMLQGFSQIYDLFQNPDTMGQFNDKLLSVRDGFLNWANRQDYLSTVNVKAQLDHAAVAGTEMAKGTLLWAAQLFLAETPTILLNLFIFICAFGAFLVIQPRIWFSLDQALNLGQRGREHFKRFEKICGLALGSVLITGLVQSVLVVLGSAIAGSSSLFMIFGVTFFFALIPVLGAGLVPVLLALFAFFNAEYGSATILVVTAGVVGVADNVLRAWLFSRAAKSNPVLSLISLLGGIALFGFTGLFLAPVIEQLVMIYAFGDQDEPALNPAPVIVEGQTWSAGQPDIETDIALEGVPSPS